MCHKDLLSPLGMRQRGGQVPNRGSTTELEMRLGGVDLETRMENEDLKLGYLFPWNGLWVPRECL